MEPLSELGHYGYLPAVSPDGARLVAADSIRPASDVDLFLYDLNRRSRTLITPDGASVFPVWSADAERIFFARFGVGGDSDLYWLPADGGGTPQSMADRPYDQYPTDASRDGSLLAFTDENPETGFDVYVMRLDGDDESTTTRIAGGLMKAPRRGLHRAEGG